MNYEAKNYDRILGLEGLSDQLLKNHFTLYQGYVTNTNKILELLENLRKDGKESTPEFAELKRRFGWEFNGMRLHEFYFANLDKSPKKITEDSLFAKKAAQDFGSFENWQKDFVATGAMRGIGWVITYYDPHVKRLLNTWINEHDVGHLANCTPVLVMDVFEHAFMIDYGTKKADYITAFFKNVEWKVVEERFENASK